MTTISPTFAYNRPVSVLVVEDDRAIRDFCARALQLNGYQVTTAEHGRDALAHTTHTTYDIVITDLNMPEMSGLELMHALRQTGVNADVIVLTAFGSFETAQAALRLGAFDYLTKPITLGDLERAVQRAYEFRRVRQEKRRLSEIVALYELSQAFTRTLDIDASVQAIVPVLWQRFAPQSLSLSLLHPDEHELELLAQHGLHAQAPRPARLPVRGSDAQSVMHTHRALVGMPIHHTGRDFTVVLRTHDRIVGVLCLVRGAEQPPFDQDDRTLLTICASQIAASLDNSRLYKQLKDQHLQMIQALVTAIDARDPYTHGHAEQVMRYAVRLAEVLGLAPQEIEAVRYGALLHDIGKIGIRDHILLKPAPLTDAELAVMQQHPSIGAEIVRGVASLRHIVPMIEGHHERIDGAGYPWGKLGADLAAETRILAIADAYDTMTSDRAYRKGMPPEQAFAILWDGSGTHWDAEFVAAFIALIQREGTTLQATTDRAAQMSFDGLLERAVGSRIVACHDPTPPPPPSIPTTHCHSG